MQEQRDPLRGTGRTTQMLKRALKAVNAGYTVHVILANSHQRDYTRNLLLHVCGWNKALANSVVFDTLDTEIQGHRADTVRFVYDHHALAGVTWRDKQFYNYEVLNSRGLLI